MANAAEQLQLLALQNLIDNPVARRRNEIESQVIQQRGDATRADQASSLALLQDIERDRIIGGNQQARALDIIEAEKQAKLDVAGGTSRELQAENIFLRSGADQTLAKLNRDLEGGLIIDRKDAEAELSRLRKDLDIMLQNNQGNIELSKLVQQKKNQLAVLEREIQGRLSVQEQGADLEANTIIPAQTAGQLQSIAATGKQARLNIGASGEQTRQNIGAQMAADIEKESTLIPIRGDMQMSINAHLNETGKDFASHEHQLRELAERAKEGFVTKRDATLTELKKRLLSFEEDITARADDRRAGIAENKAIQDSYRTIDELFTRQDLTLEQIAQGFENELQLIVARSEQNQIGQRLESQLRDKSDQLQHIRDLFRDAAKVQNQLRHAQGMSDLQLANEHLRERIEVESNAYALGVPLVGPDGRKLDLNNPVDTRTIMKLTTRAELANQQEIETEVAALKEAGTLGNSLEILRQELAASGVDFVPKPGVKPGTEYFQIRDILKFVEKAKENLKTISPEVNFESFIRGKSVQTIQSRVFNHFKSKLRSKKEEAVNALQHIDAAKSMTTDELISQIVSFKRSLTEQSGRSFEETGKEGLPDVVPEKVMTEFIKKLGSEELGNEIKRQFQSGAFQQLFEDIDKLRTVTGVQVAEKGDPFERVGDLDPNDPRSKPLITDTDLRDIKEDLQDGVLPVDLLQDTLDTFRSTPDKDRKVQELQSFIDQGLVSAKEGESTAKSIFNLREGADLGGEKPSFGFIFGPDLEESKIDFQDFAVRFQHDLGVFINDEVNPALDVIAVKPEGERRELLNILRHSIEERIEASEVDDSRMRGQFGAERDTKRMIEKALKEFDERAKDALKGKVKQRRILRSKAPGDDLSRVDGDTKSSFNITPGNAVDILADVSQRQRQAGIRQA